MKGKIYATTALLMTLSYAVGPPIGATADGCSDHDDSGGFGGQDLWCGISCDAGSEYTIKVSANDEDASVNGDVSCGGGIDGFCSGNAVVSNQCDGAGGPAKEPSEEGDCSGSSSEAWDSGLDISCEVTPGGNFAIDECELAGICLFMSSVHIVFLNGETWAESCRYDECHTFEPICERVGETGVICAA